MKTLFIDCRSGASGDMTLGAMLSLGVPLDVLEKGLASLGLNEFELSVNEKEYNGSPVTDVDVILYNKENAWIHPYSGKFRNYGEIKEMIQRSDINDHAKNLSRQIFDIKAIAESEAHGVPVDEVQFHEVGAVDSIVDIVGAAICLDYISADTVVSTPVPTGFGTVQCAWGTLPVPAPATAAILRNTGIPHYRSDIEQELLTPTGASVLAGVVDHFLEEDSFEQAWKGADQGVVGRGTGKRDTGLPPMTVMLAETKQRRKHNMKKIYLNCENGVSGDMVLNALIDLNEDPQAVRSEIHRISHQIGASHEHQHDHEHDHVHNHDEHVHEHFHRSYSDVKHIIESIDVSSGVKAAAQQIYAVIAKAESTVHGDSLEELHFHEVGRDQAIANVVGVAVCLNELHADTVIVSDICDGHGTVKCAHGVLNVPVPAVKAMLDDCDLSYKQTEYEGEMVTPSGLAMVIGSGAVTGDKPEGMPVRTSEAFGGRRTGEHGLIAELYID